MASKKAGEKERLDILLVERGLSPSRERARARILAGQVIVDDHRVDKPGTRVAVGSNIRLRGEDHPWVSRGGLKLDHALRTFVVAVAGRVAMDVGASTGGFTHVLLAGGVELVHAIDVGYGQLAEPVRTDPRVRVMERTHIKDVARLDPLPDLAVIDVSFISLALVLPHVQRLLRRPGEVVALIKPQFEAGREAVGKGGIVKDPADRQRAVDKVLAAAQALGFAHQGTTESPVTGQDGNVELLAHWTWR